MLKPLYCFANQQQYNDGFPPPRLALREPDGLLAMGGDLSVDTLLSAYRNGIFPWYSDDQPILWWSPNPRCVLKPENLHISRTLRKTLRQNWDIRVNSAFEAVISACAAPRAKASGTWITSEMRAAYVALHQAGYAHSIEAWQNNELVGGLYGVALGKLFFGESMFSRRTDASKVAFVHLAELLKQAEFGLIDCQVHSAHLATLGAATMPRNEFVEQVKRFSATQHGMHWPTPATRS